MIFSFKFRPGAAATDEGRGSEGADEGGVGDVQASHPHPSPETHRGLCPRSSPQQRPHPHHRAGDEEVCQGQ
jgi:hypothetical protein